MADSIRKQCGRKALKFLAGVRNGRSDLEALEKAKATESDLRSWCRFQAFNEKLAQARSGEGRVRLINLRTAGMSEAEKAAYDRESDLQQGRDRIEGLGYRTDQYGNWLGREYE